MIKNIDVLLWGIYFCDLIFSQLDEFPQLGKEIYSKGFTLLPGGCFTTALALNRLGINSGWVCDFGNDELSKFIINQARIHKLYDRFFVYHDHPIQRITASLSYPEDRAFISYFDNVPQTSIEPYLIEYHPKWLLLPHLHFGTQTQNIFRISQQNNVKVFMDCQSTNATLSTPGVIKALQSVDIFAPNLSEALQLTGAMTVTEALEILSRFTPVVVVKLGSEGAIAQTGNKQIKATGYSVNVKDTTGAGDCFNTGYLYGLLMNASIEDCLKYANICGGLSTQGYGGLESPTVDQVEAARISKNLLLL